MVPLMPQLSFCSNTVLTTAEAQEILDWNSETIAQLMKIQEELAKPGGASEAVLARKEKLQARLQRRSPAKSAWPYPQINT